MTKKRRWINKRVEGDTFIDRILNQSGIMNKEYFLNGTIDDIPSILLIKDGKKAVSILREAIKSGKKIGLHYDYDTDGVGGGSSAYLMLKELGANVYAYSNNRFKLGYGICRKAIDEMMEENPDTEIIITIDNGISAIDAVEYAKSLGLTVIVTDHHEPADELPKADAIINPKLKGCGYPFRELCGAGVIWKLIRELYENKDDSNKYLDIVAISTVGDVVPLIEENRIIVKEGLKLLREERRLSLRILKEETETDEITSDSTLAFLYSPIFNASSRLKGDITDVFDMLVSDDEEFIRETVIKLVALNNKRKDYTNNQLQIAEEMLEGVEIKEVIVLFHQDFDEGIVGLIAGRIKEKYNRPTIILAKAKDGELKGSGRSIEGFDMKEGFSKASSLLLGFGGHYMAGGLSIKEENLVEFEKKMIDIAKDVLTEDDLVKKFEYNFAIKEEQVSHELINTINSLEPFGEGFKSPIFKMLDCEVHRVQFMGKEKEHLKLMGKKVSMISWRNAELFKERCNSLNINALGSLSINTFRGVDNLQFMILEDNFY